MESKAYHSGESESDNSQTPWWVIKQIQDVANATIIHDVCATEVSKKADTFWSKEDDALKQDWALTLFKKNAGYEQVNCLWMNPPFSMAKEFTQKAFQESCYGAVVLGCVKHTPDVDWFQKMEKQATFIYVPDGRISFEKHDGSKFKNGANFPVCFPLWTPFNNGGEAKQVRFARDKKKYL